MSIRSSVVLNTFVDLSTRSAYCLDRFAQEAEPLGRGQTMIIPDLGALTIYRDASVPRAAGARNAPQNLVNELTLTVDEEPWIPMQMRNMDNTFNLSGNWDQQVGQQAFIQLKNLIDSIVIDDYLVGEACWLANGVSTYHFNDDADGVQPKDFLVARGMALRSGGVARVNLMWVLDSLCVSAIMDFKGWVTVASNSDLGATTVGTLYGIEVVETQGVRLSKEFTPATAAVAGNVATYTFATNPGLVVGDPIRTNGMKANYDLTEPTPISTVSADGLSITVPHPGADDAGIFVANADVISAAAHNLLVDRSFVHVAQTQIPKMRDVDDPDTNGVVKQIWALLGFIARVGRVWAIKSPEMSIE